MRITYSHTDMPTEVGSGFHQRLKQLVGDGTKAKFARDAGISAAGFQRIYDGGDPGLKSLIAIARAGQVSVQWLADGTGPKELEMDQAFALIPRHEVSASAGHGLVPVDNGEIADLIAFRRDWLNRLGINPDRAALIEASGDSMEPTIPDGALMLIDMNMEEVRHGMIYAIVRGDDLLVKRVHKKIDGHTILISDSPHYPDEEIDEAMLDRLRVVGRVRWVGRAF